MAFAVRRPLRWWTGAIDSENELRNFRTCCRREHPETYVDNL